MTSNGDAVYYDLTCFDPYYNYCDISAMDNVALTPDRTKTATGMGDDAKIAESTLNEAPLLDIRGKR